MSATIAAQNTPAPYGNAHGNVRVEAPSPLHRSGSDHVDRPSPAPRQSSKEPQTGGVGVDPRNRPLPHEKSSSNVQTEGTHAVAGRVNSEKRMAEGEGHYQRPEDKSPSSNVQSEQLPVTDRVNSEKRMAEGEGRVEPQEDEQGAARGEGKGATDQPSEGAPGVEYPEQMHAGRLDGLGPEYDKIHGTTMSDRFHGLKEQVKGTVKRDPEMKQRGKERMTGELKKKERREKEGSDPLTGAQEGAAEVKNPEPQEAPQKRTESGMTDAPATHPTEKGAEEQASSVKPEGNNSTTQEERAHSTASNAQIS